VAQDHAHPEAIGIVDESGVAKSGKQTVGVGRQWLPSRRHCLIVARNVLSGEMKYFVANRVPGEKGTTLRWLLRVAFGRWSVEHCFRDAKDELGFDHYQVRGWRCVHRHCFVTQLNHQRRNKQSRVSHTKTRIASLAELGIDVDHIKSCIT